MEASGLEAEQRRLSTIASEGADLAHLSSLSPPAAHSTGAAGLLHRQMGEAGSGGAAVASIPEDAGSRSPAVETLQGEGAESELRVSLECLAVCQSCAQSPRACCPTAEHHARTQCCECSPGTCFGQFDIVCCRRISWQAPSPPPLLSRCLYPRRGWLPQCLSSMHLCLGFWSRQWPMLRLLWAGQPQLLMLRAPAMLCPWGLGKLLRLQRSRGGPTMSISSHRLLMLRALGMPCPQVLLMVTGQLPQQRLLQRSRSHQLHPWPRERWPAPSVNFSDRWAVLVDSSAAGNLPEARRAISVPGLLSHGLSVEYFLLVHGLMGRHW